MERTWKMINFTHQSQASWNVSTNSYQWNPSKQGKGRSDRVSLKHNWNARTFSRHCVCQCLTPMCPEHAFSTILPVIFETCYSQVADIILSLLEIVSNNSVGYFDKNTCATTETSVAMVTQIYQMISWRYFLLRRVTVNLIVTKWKWAKSRSFHNWITHTALSNANQLIMSLKS